MKRRIMSILTSILLIVELVSGIYFPTIFVWVTLGLSWNWYINLLLMSISAMLTYFFVRFVTRFL